jgi:hypothetical protein
MHDSAAAGEVIETPAVTTAAPAPCPELADSEQGTGSAVISALLRNFMTVVTSTPQCSAAWA